MKAKRILLCAVSLVLLLLIVVRIVHVNTNVLTIPEERYAQNQWVELNGAFQEMDDENTEGYSVRILGAEQLTYNEFLEKFDFVETFNACIRPWANACADNLAGCLHKPKVAGSDAHKMRVVGAAYTEFTQKIANNNDLIRAIKEGWVQAQGGSVLKEMEEETNFLLQKAANAGYWVYNKLGALWNWKKLRWIRKKIL